MDNVTPKDVKQHPIAQLNAWMQKIADNLRYDARRRESRRFDIVPIEGTLDGDGDGLCVEEILSDPQVNVEDEALAGIERAALHRVVARLWKGARLSEQQRNIIRLRLEGWNNVRIADTLNTTPATVDSQYHRARKRLYKCLQALRAHDSDVDQVIKNVLSKSQGGKIHE